MTPVAQVAAKPVAGSDGSYDAMQILFQKLDEAWEEIDAI